MEQATAIYMQVHRTCAPALERFVQLGVVYKVQGMNLPDELLEGNAQLHRAIEWASYQLRTCQWEALRD